MRIPFALAIPLALSVFAPYAKADCLPQVDVTAPSSGELMIQALPDATVAHLRADRYALPGSGLGTSDCKGVIQAVVIFSKPTLAATVLMASKISPIPPSVRRT